MRPHWTYQHVTTMTTRRVDRGHFECREVYSHRRAFKNRVGRLCGRYDDCCNPCPPPTRTAKVWVPCIVCEQVPVTTCRKVCEMRPTVVRVHTCRTEVREVPHQVTSWRCVPQHQVVKCTVMTTRMVPYEAVRHVAVCVPHVENVTLCRMVPRVVAEQVPCDGGAQVSCFSTCGSSQVKSRRGFRGHRGRCCD
jgi:hypothetical protein